MTMALRFGLVGAGMAGSGDVVGQWSQQGQQVSVDVEYTLTDVSDALAVLDQLLGLAEPSTSAPVVPVEWDEEPARTGYYRVDSVDTSSDRRLRRSNRVLAKLNLTKVTGSSSLAGEHALWGADRAAAPTTSSWVGNEPNPWVAWPSSWGIAADVFGVVNPGPLQRAVSSTLSMHTLVNFSSDYNTTVLTSPTPAKFYDGACTVRAGYPLQYVTGRRQMIDADYWEISNGLVKVTPPTTAARAFEIKYRNQAGTAWSTRTRAAAFWVDSTYTAITAGCNPQSVTVTRYTPEQVSIRLGVPVSYLEGITYLDLTLRRGSRFLQVTLSSSFPSGWAIGHETGFSGAWGGIDLPTVGSTETNADVDGNKSILMLGSVQVAGVTFNASGRVYNGPGVSGYNSIDVAFAAEIGGGSAILYDDAPHLERQYMAAMGETFRVVQQ